MTTADDWPRCKGWIEAAIKPSGLYEIEDIERQIAEGSMEFWAGENCAAVTEISIYPNCKVLNVFAGGGTRGKALKELTRKMEPAFLDWGRLNGCKKIMGFGIYEAWKPVCERMGYKMLWTVMAKDI